MACSICCRATSSLSSFFGLSWDPSHKRSSGHVLSDDSASRNDGSLSHGDPIEHHGTNADQASIENRCAVYDGAMPNRDVLANGYGFTWIAVEHGTVLHVAALSNAD